ncbi:hypothetical protein [Streptomyces sp. NPDC018059]|uniref:hypothetical protein n=1 Tax=Streptomyces sp. NPDC018059 TaxID=3365041 RepID=UPI00378D7E02
MEVDVDVDADMKRAAIAGKGVGGSADLGVDDSSAAFSGGPFLDSGERGVASSSGGERHLGEHRLGHSQLHAVGYVLVVRAIEHGGDMGEVAAPERPPEP